MLKLSEEDKQEVIGMIINWEWDPQFNNYDYTQTEEFKALSEDQQDFLHEYIC